MLTHKDISDIRHELGVLEGLCFSFESGEVDFAFSSIEKIAEIIEREENLLIERGPLRNTSKKQEE